MSVYRRFVLTVCVLTGLLLNGCALYHVKGQQQKIEEACLIRGTVKPDQPGDGNLVVVLLRHKGGDFEQRTHWALVDHFLLEQPGRWFFHANPGTYYLTAFQDVNRDHVFERDEPAIPVDVRGAFICTSGQSQAEQGLVIPHEGRIPEEGAVDIAALQVRSAEEQMQVSVGQALALGEVTGLDNPVFSRENAGKGLWKPFDFLWNSKPGLYFLENYDPNKTPVLFVHGINGTPLDFKKLIERLDRTRFQPWVYYYPSGMKLQTIGLYLDRLVMQLKFLHDFKRMLLVAHSMGGLVSRRALLDHAEAFGDGLIPLFVSIATPWNGHRAAQLGVDYAPTAVFSWTDMAPGSQFLQGLYYQKSGERRRLPQGLEHHLIFSFLTTESGDGTVSLSSELREEAQEEAKHLYGFARSHMEVLDDPKTAALLNRLLLEAEGR